LAVVITGREICADKVVLASGGLSYPDTGSTGDGLRMAEALGHTIIPPRPALVPLVTQENWPGSLAGVSVDRVTVSARPHGRKVAESGAMLFTQDGIGGPAILNLSRHLTDCLPNRTDPIQVHVDLVPAMSDDDLERRARQWAQASPKKTIGQVLADLVPRRLAAVVAGQAGGAGDLQTCQLTKEARRRLVAVLKTLELHIVGTRPMAEATVMRGGVDAGQIEPKTMESRICPGLFFAGEVIDVDGPCGGYNLQICWSTGALAGRSAACSLIHGSRLNR
jgi:predicted Rossmann fold flavoprotein